ncbi:hypothetical protein ABSL23_02365 [Halobacterium sp. NMX12-1]|uniref:CopG family transcriptional regulator n=1 Tax=Halobacterium sp. NMX12-1 TaxID=3166650 RepID=A0AAU8CDQ6_9EURY
MSGNRLAGDDGSESRSKADERAETRLSGTLLQRFETFRDDHGVSEAQLLRDALDDYLPEAETSEYVVPRDPDLRDAYTTLASPDKKRYMSVEKVENILTSTSHPNTPKDLIREDVIEPLDDGGLLNVGGGMVVVDPLTRKEDAFGADETEDDGRDTAPADAVEEASEQMDALEAAEPEAAD